MDGRSFFCLLYPQISYCWLFPDKKTRLTELMEKPDTEWRVTSEDLWQQREYKRFREGFDQFMEETQDAALPHGIFQWG